MLASCAGMGGSRGGVRGVMNYILLLYIADKNYQVESAKPTSLGSSARVSP
jgi:hypothetical protein